MPTPSPASIGLVLQSGMLSVHVFDRCGQTLHVGQLDAAALENGIGNVENAAGLLRHIVAAIPNPILSAGLAWDNAREAAICQHLLQQIRGELLVADSATWVGPVAVAGLCAAGVAEPSTVVGICRGTSTVQYLLNSRIAATPEPVAIRAGESFLPGYESYRFDSEWLARTAERFAAIIRADDAYVLTDVLGHILPPTEAGSPPAAPPPAPDDWQKWLGEACAIRLAMEQLRSGGSIEGNSEGLPCRRLVIAANREVQSPANLFRWQLHANLLRMRIALRSPEAGFATGAGILAALNGGSTRYAHASNSMLIQAMARYDQHIFRPVLAPAKALEQFYHVWLAHLPD